MSAIRTGAAVLIALVAIVAAGCGSGGAPIGKDSLAKQSEAVQSLAAEGALLAEDSAAGRSTRVFRQEHSSELATAATTVVKSLESARTTSELRPKLRKLRGIAAQVRATLGRLGSASTSEQRAIGRRLEGAAKASEQLGEGLG